MIDSGRNCRIEGSSVDACLSAGNDAFERDRWMDAGKGCGRIQTDCSE
jgi:hypothetical protein